MNEFPSPYHALAAQTEALVQLIDALQNAQRYGLYLRIEYDPQRASYRGPDKVIVKARTCDLYDYDDEVIPIPETTEWDVTYLFKNSKLGESDQFGLFLAETSS